MATHSSILAWRMPQTDEPGRLTSLGCKESDMTEETGHTCIYVCIYTHTHAHIWIDTLLSVERLQIFSLIPQAVFSFCLWFPLLCKS